jgi:hypothetical protein
MKIFNIIQQARKNLEVSGDTKSYVNFEILYASGAEFGTSREYAKWTFLGWSFDGYHEKMSSLFELHRKEISPLLWHMSFHGHNDDIAVPKFNGNIYGHLNARRNCIWLSHAIHSKDKSKGYSTKHGIEILLGLENSLRPFLEIQNPQS